MTRYRTLLRAYPRAFRDEYGAEMEAIFAARRRAVSGLGVMTLWFDVIADTLLNASRVHLDILVQDIRHGVRSLRRARGFTVTAVLVSALGVGATTAAFSLADHVLVRPLPFPDSHRLVQMWQDKTRAGAPRLEQSPSNFLDWVRLSTSFEGMAAYTTRSVNMVGHGAPERLDVALVTPHLFGVLRMPAALGRALSTLDEGNSQATVVLSDAFWRARFAADPNILGQTLVLDDAPHVVVGVMPPHFGFPRRDIEIWTPLRFSPQALADRTDTYLNVVARLKDTVSLAQARSEMQLIAAQLERAFPDDNKDTGATVALLRDQVSRQSRTLLLAMAAAAACMLLIASLNLASLLLARALNAQRDLAVRYALGGGWDRLVRQLVTEAGLITAAGGLLGVAIAVGVTPLAAQLVPHAMPIPDAPAVDLRMLGIAALTTVLTGVFFGVLPALQAVRASDPSLLRSGSRAGDTKRHELLRSGLVVAEVIGSVVLIVATGLLLRALWQVQQTDPGFRTENVLAVRTVLPWPKYERTARRHDFYDRVIADVRALPGVTNASYITSLPMVWRGGIWGVTTDLAGLTPESRERWNPDPGQLRPASLRQVTPGFFDTVGIPLLQGRDISDADTFDAQWVAVVSQSFVDQHWPGQDPLGRQFFIAFRERTVVGVVGDVRVRGLERESEPQVYLPARQVPDGGLIAYPPQELVVSGTVPVMSLVSAIREAVARADAQQPVAEVRRLADVVTADTATRRVQVRVLAGFALVALLLVSVGLHGLLSFAVTSRTRDIGVQMALGARPGSILRTILARGLILSAIGGCVGALLAVAAARMLQSLLAGVSPADPYVIAGAMLLAVVMTLAGSFLPARRAARIDPIEAMRST